MTKQYDQEGNIGITRAEYERALANTNITQNYQDPTTKREFIFLGKNKIADKEFTSLEIEVRPTNTIKPKQEDKLFSPELVALVNDNLYRFPSDNKDLTKKILSTFKFQ